jgi:hypothetical protein
MELNHLLQQHMRDWYAIAQEYRRVIAGIRQMFQANGGASAGPYAAQLTALLEKASEQAPQPRKPSG